MKEVQQVFVLKVLFSTNKMPMIFEMSALLKAVALEGHIIYVKNTQQCLPEVGGV